MHLNKMMQGLTPSQEEEVKTLLRQFISVPKGYVNTKPWGLGSWIVTAIWEIVLPFLGTGKVGTRRVGEVDEPLYHMYQWTLGRRTDIYMRPMTAYHLGMLLLLIRKHRSHETKIGATIAVETEDNGTIHIASWAIDKVLEQCATICQAHEQTIIFQCDEVGALVNKLRTFNEEGEGECETQPKEQQQTTKPVLH